MTAIATTHWAGHHRHHHKPRADKRRVGKLLVGAALMRAMSEGRRRHGGGGHGARTRRSGPVFGPGGFGPRLRRGPGGRGQRARRGDIRAAVLLLLAEEPRNGYQLMQEIEERSGGVWRPSPGSVYPALAQLEDEGLVRSEESADGARSRSPTRAAPTSRSTARPRRAVGGRRRRGRPRACSSCAS